jgi:Fe-Mn family superoxide dismutase
MPLNARRDFLKTTALATVAVGAGRAADPTPAFTLPALPYAPEALEAAIDAETMRIHHGKHHAAYIKNLNAALDKVPGLAAKGLDSLVQELSKVPEEIRTAVRNNGGGHWNHSLFWQIMAPAGSGGEPSAALGAAITKTFGGLEQLQKTLNDKALATFGSGWGWLIAKPGGDLSVVATPNQDNPLMKGVVAEECLGVPLIAIDVWEHAYYLRYQNRRADYLAAWWKLVNWSEVSRRFSSTHV